MTSLVIPIGGGGLIAGNAIAARAKKPAIEIVGAEAALYPSVWNALHGENRPIGGPTGAAPNATSAPTPSTRSCSTRSALRCCAPTCSPPASRPSPCAPAPDDELLGAELARLDRKLDATHAERRRLIDLYQAGLLKLPKLQRRATEVEHRRDDLALRRDALTTQRQELTRDNQLRRRVRDFATRVLAVIDTLDFDQKQTLLRLVVEDVHVTGWHIQIQLRIPLDDGPDGQSRPPGSTPDPDDPGPMSTQDRLRSLGAEHVAVVQQSVEDGGGQDVVGEHAAPLGESFVAGQDDAAAFVAAADQLEHHVRRGPVQRQVANLVQDEDDGAEVGLEFLGEPAGGLGDAQLADGLIQAGEVDRVAGRAGRDGQGDGEVGRWIRPAAVRRVSSTGPVRCGTSSATCMFFP